MTRIQQQLSKEVRKALLKEHQAGRNWVSTAWGRPGVLVAGVIQGFKIIPAKDPQKVVVKHLSEFRIQDDELSQIQRILEHYAKSLGDFATEIKDKHLLVSYATKENGDGDELG